MVTRTSKQTSKQTNKQTLFAFLRLTLACPARHRLLQYLDGAMYKSLDHALMDRGGLPKHTVNVTCREEGIMPIDIKSNDGTNVSPWIHIKLSTVGYEAKDGEKCPFNHDHPKVGWKRLNPNERTNVRACVLSSPPSGPPADGILRRLQAARLLPGVLPRVRRIQVAMQLCRVEGKGVGGLDELVT